MEVFTATLLVVFRETLEAGLIVGIILTVLAKLNALRYRKDVFLSVAAAVAASFAIAFIFHLSTQSITGMMEKWLEGGVSLVACAVLTHMIFWMDQQGKRIRPEIEEKVEMAISRGEYLTIVSLPFLSVLREGAETVLFLAAVSIQHSRSVSWLGGIAGSAAAIAISWLIFFGGKKLPVKAFFRSTGLLLLLIAAGLLAYGVHEFQELGLLPLEQTAWNINHILNEKQGIGSFLKSLFGYNGNPSILEVIVYSLYLLVVAYFLRLGIRPQTAPAKG